MRRSFLTLAAAAVIGLFTASEASACHKSCCKPACPPPPCPPPVVCYVPPPVCAPVCAPKHCISLPKFHMPKLHCKPACAPVYTSYAYAPAPVYATGQSLPTPQK